MRSPSGTYRSCSPSATWWIKSRLAARCGPAAGHSLRSSGDTTRSSRDGHSLPGCVVHLDFPPTGSLISGGSAPTGWHCAGIRLAPRRRGNRAVCQRRSDFLQLAPSDHRMVEDPEHRDPQRLRAVNADEDRPGRVHASLTQPDEQLGAGTTTSPSTTRGTTSLPPAGCRSGPADRGFTPTGSGGALR